MDIRRADARAVAMGGGDLPRPAATASDVEMIAAYFAPTWAMLRRIARAAEHGRARIITAAKSDNATTIAAARHTYKRLLRRGVEIFEYQPTKLHSKLVVLDDIVHIGSSNFDIRSLYLNLEMMLRVDDAGFADADAQLFRGRAGGEYARSLPNFTASGRRIINRINLGAELLPGHQRRLHGYPPPEPRHGLGDDDRARDRPRTGSRGAR